MNQETNASFKPINVQKANWKIGCIIGLIVLVVIIIVGIFAPKEQEKQKPTAKQEQNQSTINKPQTEQKKEPEKSKETLPRVGDNVRVGDIRWKLISAKDLGNILYGTNSNYPTITDDKTTSGKFIQINMEVENLSKDLKSVSNLDIYDDSGRKFIHSTDTSEWIPNEKSLYILSNLNPNMPNQFMDIYEVPGDAKNLYVSVGDLKLFGAGSAKISLGF